MATTMEQAAAVGPATVGADGFVHVFACWTNDRHGPLFCRWTPAGPPSVSATGTSRDDAVLGLQDAAD